MSRSVVILFLLVYLVEGYCQSLDSTYLHAKIYKNIKKALRHKDGVVVLDLSEKRLRSLPEEIGSFKNLEVLNLDGNSLRNFPSSITKLEKLKVIKVSDNGLDSIPGFIYDLPNLKKLYLSRNNISSISPRIVKLHELQFIDLSFNDLNDRDANFVREALPNCFVLVYLRL